MLVDKRDHNDCCLYDTGASGCEEFIHTVFAVVEGIAQHPALLTEYYVIVMEQILPNLSQLVSSAQG